MSIIVSDSAAEEALQAYAHPLSIQAKAIQSLEDTVLNGNKVTDGNNVFTFLTEYSSNLVAGLVNKACDCFHSLYPENAQTSSDLYKHLSDFDYIGLFSSPAMTEVELVFDRNFIIDNAVKYDDYYKIVIPEYSKFTIGEYVFGLMYPIEIRVRKAPLLPNGHMDYDNCVITVMWDTSKKNPLQTLEAHILEHREFKQDNQMLTAISVPIYQFEVTNHLESAVASSGFARRYDYTDKFYAIRVFHWKNGQWNEMAQTFSNINYDVDIPTAMIKVLPELGKVEVVVPQIYFDTTSSTAKIGNRILIKMYTTRGELNINISEYNFNQFAASFLMTDTILVEDDTYSGMLKRIPTILVIPLSRRISSGSNGLSIEELRKRVKHSTSYTVKITPDDLDAYFDASGYTFTKDLDNITDRVYCAHKVITDSTGTTIEAGEGKTKFTPEMLKMEEDEYGKLYVPGYSDISVLDANTVTILPSAVYKYDKENDQFVMISDNDKVILNGMSVVDRVHELNTTLYTYSPFHVRLSMDPSLPIAGSYDLYNPSLKSITFDWENSNTTAELSVYSADIKVLEDDNKTGYRLSIAVYRTANLANVSTMEVDGQDIMNIQVMLGTVNSRGVRQYMLGTYNGVDKAGHDIFIFDITSTFKITKDGLIDATSMCDESGEVGNDFIDIDTHKYTLDFFVKEEFITDTDYPMDGVDVSEIPGKLEEYVYLCRQSFKMKLGECLPLVKNNVSLGVTNQQYETYPTTEFATYTSPIYERWTVGDYKLGHCTIDKIGTLKLIYNDVTQKYEPSIKHNAGDVIISSKYDMPYAQTLTIETPDEMLGSLELREPLTATSSPTNVWESIEGDIVVNGTAKPRCVGVYSIKDRSTTGINRAWIKNQTVIDEVFDTTSIDVNTDFILYRFIDEDGSVVYTLNRPAVQDYDIVGHVAGRYRSCNSDIVKDDIKASGVRPDSVNTSARGTARKWFLLTNDDTQFDFIDFTGFIIEYGPIGTNDSGLENHWNLVYYYKELDEETGLVSTQTFIVDQDLSISDKISDNDKTKLDVDSHVAQYDDIHHVIKFVDIPEANLYGWILSETVDPQGVHPLEALYYAKCYKSIDIYEPWEAEWTAIDDKDKSTPVITLMNGNTSHVYKLEVAEALGTICSYIQTNSLASISADKLYKYLDNGILTEDTVFRADKTYYTRQDSGSPIIPYVYDEAEVTVGEEVTPNTYYEKTDTYIVDPLEGKLFACVSTCTDKREQEYCNSLINYAPGIPDPYGETTGDVVRDLEVGTATAAGAVYYRDIGTTSITNMTYNIPIDNGSVCSLMSIIKAWYRYAAEPAATRYKHIAKDTGLTVSILSRIISDTEPCFFSPWKKLVTVSSFGALYGDEVSYYNNRYIVNCSVVELLAIQTALKNGVRSFETFAEAYEYAQGRPSTDAEYAMVSDISDAPEGWTQVSILGAVTNPVCAIVKLEGNNDSVVCSCVRADYTLEEANATVMQYNVWSGYMYVLSKGLTKEDMTPAYYHYTSKIDRTYSTDAGFVTRNEFNINFEASIWSNIDKWPWELSSYWMSEDGKVVNLSTSYNTSLSAAKVKHMNTDVMVNGKGEPIIAANGSRNVTYTLTMLHCDYKLTQSSDADYIDYMNDIRSLLRSYYSELNSISPSLLARTKMYYSPIKTFGMAKFKGNNGTEVTLPVGFSVDLGLHVEAYVNGSDLNKETIRRNITSIIDNRLKNGYINLAEIANDIMDGLSDNIICVDVLGIDGDSTLQTLIPFSNDCHPQLRQILVVNDDGSVHVERELNLNWSVIE